MRSYFYRYPAAAHSRKLLRHAFHGCGHAAFRKQLTVVSQRAIAAGLVSQVHADRDRPFFSSCCPFRTLLHGAILFHGRSPFALRVRLIGSLSHPAGGRPSHSISVTMFPESQTITEATTAGSPGRAKIETWQTLPWPVAPLSYL